VDAVGPVGSCLMFATPDAHLTGGTDGRLLRIRLEGLFDSRLPPRIGLGRPVGGQRRRDRRFHLGGLRGDQLDVHGGRS